VLCRPILKRQAGESLTTESDCKKLRLDDVSGETIAQILQVINDPKKMLGPEVRSIQFAVTFVSIELLG